jgi:hypothetical protein
MHGHLVDFNLSQRYSQKNDEYTVKVVAYNDGEYFASREWTHYSSEVLAGLTKAFLLMCDAVCFPGPPDEPKPATKDELTQLSLF